VKFEAEEPLEDTAIPSLQCSKAPRLFTSHFPGAARYTHLSSDHKQRAVRALEQFGEKSQQFSQQARGQGTYGSRKPLKKAALP